MELYERSLGRSINHISRLVHWLVRNELEAYGVGSGQHAIMVLVYRYPGITQNEISSKGCVDKATVAKGLAHLEKLSLLRREADPDDRRLRHVYLTDAGSELMPVIIACLRNVTDTCSAGLTPDETDVLFSLLDKVEHALVDYIEDTGSESREKGKR